MTPATVCTSTPLNPESVDNIIATEKPDACVVQFGGQTAIKLAKHMDEIGLPILGTPRMPLTKQRTVSALTNCWSAATSPARPAAPCSIWRRLWLPPMRSACPS